ncbi:ADP-ribose glycohydrolase OARD1-like [Aphis craccivora]|uniref:ADP-ribose glycohydrolase OARD1-like n=1 Tax=Aphis craccivora TaxID=307492 RepID=A0A6G0W2Z1_APHCR|nr:ADP-ribose glycohydrolase OARD1-like [Aphis craccivora]
MFMMYQPSAPLFEHLEAPMVATAQPCVVYQQQPPVVYHQPPLPYYPQPPFHTTPSPPSICKRVGNLMDQKQKVGSVAYLQENNRFIYYLITKELSKHKPTYNSITAAITKLRDLIVVHGVRKLAIPRIGCGLDKLDWSRLTIIIKELKFWCIQAIKT